MYKRQLPDRVDQVFTVEVPDVGAVQDVNVVLDIAHTFMGDLEVTLTSPDGTSVVLVDNVGGGDDGYDVVLNDSAFEPVAFGSSDETGRYVGTYLADEALEAFEGGLAAGTWSLRIVDTFNEDDGELLGWSLVFSEATVPGCLLYTSPSPRD